MSIFVSTFISGLKELIEAALLNTDPSIKIINTLDGLVVYKSNAAISEIKKLKFFNNSFLLLKKFQNMGQQNPIEKMLKNIAGLKNLEELISTHVPPFHKNKTFRIMVSIENRFAVGNKHYLKIIEKKIAKVASLRLDRRNPAIEFWFLLRREGVGFFMLRLTKHPAYEKVLKKGELRPELAHILCIMSQPNRDDIFLDPFCGYGAIPVERAQSFPFNLVFASDTDEEKIEYLKNRIKNLKSKKIKKYFIPKVLNALDLKAFEDNFINKIVTDPPWGLFREMTMETPEFYALMLKEFLRILKINGIIVILTAKKEEVERAAADLRDKIKIVEKYDILVSGQKAAIYRMIKND
ncbi:MAG: RsmD family RNA methyltransferase [Candidatus Aminicenantes bacterium]|jgi:23S rRNA G2445 N2-methylase RlmL